MEDRVGADGRLERLADATAYLESLRSPVASPGIDRIARLAATLGHPERSTPVIHVTGTNGKGSVSRLAEAVLRSTGRRVGLYTSPHLEHVAERIVIDGTPISEAAFVALVAEVARAIERSGELGHPTHFEALTAVGFLAFARSGLDVVVLEVGIGGRNDATNVADGRVAVITNVELDHTEVLGTTRVAIAAEKVGIVKERAVAIVGPTDPEVLPVIESRCREVGASLWRLGGEFAITSDRPTATGRVIDLATPAGIHSDLEVPFVGRYQSLNAALAVAAVEAFTGAGVDRDALDAAWRGVDNPGRFEIVEGRRTVVVDVAHNPHGAASLIEALDERFPGRARIVVVGVNPHKDAEEMLRALQPGARAVVATEVADAPAVPARVLGKIAAALGYATVVVEAESAAALAAAVALAEVGDVVVLTGSHYWIGEVRHLVVEAAGRG